MITHVISTKRWQSALLTVGYKINFKKLFILFLANFPISKISPSYSGDFLRAYTLKNSVPVNESAAIILLEGLMDVFVLSVLVFLGGILNNMPIMIIFSTLIIILIFLFIKIGPILISRLPVNFKYKNRLVIFFNVFKIILRTPKQFFPVVGYTVLMWLSMLLSIKLLFSAFSADIPFYLVVALQPISIFISLLPITISGVGTREAIMIFLFADLASQNIILATGLFYSFLSVVFWPILLAPITYMVLNKK